VTESRLKVSTGPERFRAFPSGTNVLRRRAETLSSRILLHPTNFERSLCFYEQTIGLAIYREWGAGTSRGVVFFLGGGGLLEVSGESPQTLSSAIGLVLQVRDVAATRERLREPGVVVEAEPELKPWGPVG
jgi:predicted enzyme related to lactoylglutathione lyase